MNRAAPRVAGSNLRPFVIWVIALEIAWLLIVVTCGYWSDIAARWPVSVAMVFGSYVAGSTPMGGGSVAFPVLVLLMDHAASIGRNFSFAIQSIGMTTAALFILCRRTPQQWRMLGWAMLGSLIATPTGALLIAPRADDMQVKLIFASAWASFGLLHLLKLRDITSVRGVAKTSFRFDAALGVSVGILGGLLASIIGVGIDMLCYVALVLLVRADVKVAIPTAVTLMAFTSIIGLMSNLAMGMVHREVYLSVLAAAPIVLLGAPFGAFMVSVIPHRFTLLLVSALCVLQFIWLCAAERLTGWRLLAVVGGVAACLLLFLALNRWGQARRQSASR